MDVKLLRVAISMAAISSPFCVSAQMMELEEIIVTAQHKDESLQKAGLAIDVVQGGDITDAGISQATDLGKLFPSLDLQAGGGAAVSVFLRGVGNFTNTSYTDAAIAFSYDGVYLGRTQAVGGMFYDLERVEVLKGPQGTLYGRNATGGAVNIITAKPEIGGSLSGFVSADVGNYDSKKIQGAVNIPVSDTSAIRIAGSFIDRDGYNDDGTSDEENEALRVQFASDLSDNVSLNIGVDYSHSGGLGVGANYTGTYAAVGYAYTPSGLSEDSGLYSAESQAYRTTLVNGPALNNYIELDKDPYQDNTFYGINAELNYTGEAGKLTILSGWRKGEVDNVFALPGFIGWNDETYEQKSLEIRFASEPIGNFDYLVGGYYFDENVVGDTTFNPGVLALQDFEVDTESYALFGRVTAHISDDFRITTGVRLTHDKKAMAAISQNLIVACASATCFDAPGEVLLPTVDTELEVDAYYDALAASGLPGVIYPGDLPTNAGVAPLWTNGTSTQILIHDYSVFNASQEEDNVTYRIAAEYNVLEDSMFYASFETGYRSGGFALAIGRETYKPEYLDAYTIGIKNRLFDNRVQLNLEAFFWDYTDQQVAHFGLDTQGGTANYTENVGQSTIKGIDVDLQWMATERTFVTAKAQYLDAVYDELVYIGPTDTLGDPDFNPNPTSCDKTDLGDGTMSIDCSGNTAFKSPKWIVNLGLEQVFTLGEYDLTAGLDTQFKDEYWAGFEYAQEQLVSSAWTTNAQLTLEPSTGDWSVTAYVRNIEDNRVSTNQTLQPISLTVMSVYTAPMTFGVRFQADF